MTQRTSPATAKRYTVAQVCRVWRMPRSSFYASSPSLGSDCPPARRRGP